MTSPQPEIRSKRRNLLPTLASVIWSGLILFLSLMPGPSGAVGFPGSDKLLHAGAYAVLAGLVSMAIASSGRDKSLAGKAAFLVSVAFGACIELLQGTMQLGRTAEWGDLAANTLGALLACVIFRHTSALSWRCFRTKDEGHG